MKIHTIRLLILFGLMLFAAYASHEAGARAEVIWKKNLQTTDSELVDERSQDTQLY